MSDFAKTEFVKNLTTALETKDYQESVYQVVEVFSALLETYFRSNITPEEVFLIRNVTYSAKLMANKYSVSALDYFVAFVLIDNIEISAFLRTYSPGRDGIDGQTAKFMKKYAEDKDRKQYSRIEVICNLVECDFDFSKLFTF